MYIYQLLKTIICSFIIILFFQYFWNYLKDNFSVKKTKDLVMQIEKYKKIAETQINNNANHMNNINYENGFLNNEEKEKMNEDLMNFTNTLLNK